MSSYTDYLKQQSKSLCLHFYSFILVNNIFVKISFAFSEYLLLYFGFFQLLAFLNKFINFNNKKGNSIIFIILIAYLIQDNYNNDILTKPYNYNFEQTLEFYKYPFEKFQLQTQDNYFVSVYRIQKKNQKNIIQNHSGEAILLYSGINCGLDSFIANYEEKSILFYLANLEIDVWVLNNRGNKYDRSHKFYDPDRDQQQFWNFSFSEMAEFDLPSAVEFISKKTNKKVNVLGYSQGSSALTATLTLNDQYFQNNVSKIILFSPTVYVGNQKSAIFKLAMQFSLLDTLQMLGMQEFKIVPFNFIYLFTKYTLPLNKIILHFLSDDDLSSCHIERYLNYVAHYPAGTSVKSYIHFGQLVKSKNFQKFDYGQEQNIKIYGQSQPPKYQLENIKNQNILMIAGNNDLMGSLEDNNELFKFLNINNQVQIKYIQGGHLCAMINKDVEQFQQVFRFIRGLPL